MARPEAPQSRHARGAYPRNQKKRDSTAHQSSGRARKRTVLEKESHRRSTNHAGEELYRIADLSTVWVIAEVPERDIVPLLPETGATVTFRAFPSQPMEGRVTLVYPELKP